MKEYKGGKRDIYSISEIGCDNDTRGSDVCQTYLQLISGFSTSQRQKSDMDIFLIDAQTWYGYMFPFLIVTRRTSSEHSAARFW